MRSGEAGSCPDSQWQSQNQILAMAEGTVYFLLPQASHYLSKAASGEESIGFAEAGRCLSLPWALTGHTSFYLHPVSNFLSSSAAGQPASTRWLSALVLELAGATVRAWGWGEVAEGHWSTVIELVNELLILPLAPTYPENSQWNDTAE